MNPASAKTAINQVPYLHKRIVDLHPRAMVFDFGAGRFGKVDKFMAENADLYVPYDPFHRSAQANMFAIENIKKCDFVFCSNVLNVIEDEFLTYTLKSLHYLTNQTIEGKLFLTVYHRKSLPVERKVGDHFQRNQSLDWYAEQLRCYFGHVTKHSKCPKILICFP